MFVHIQNADFCNWRRASIRTAPSKVNSSDSIEVLLESQGVCTSPSHFSESESYINSDYKETEVPRQQNKSFWFNICVEYCFSVDEELYY